MAHLIECAGCKTLMADSVRRCPNCDLPTGVGFGAGKLAVVVACLIAVAIAVVVVLAR